MALIPLKLDITNVWSEITDDIFNIFTAGDRIDIYQTHRDSQFYEVLIDTTGAVTIDSSYNGKGIRLDQYNDRIEITLSLQARYYVRSLQEIAEVSIKPSVISNNITVVDTAGKSNTIGIFGEQLATDIFNNILVQFSYGISTRDLKTPVIVGSGTVTIQKENLLAVATGVDIDGHAEIESYNNIRYRPGHTVIAQFTALWTNPTVPDAHQWIGITDSIDGFAMGFIDGEFAIMRIRNSVHTHIFKADFNGNIDINKIDFTKLNVFRITFGYLGVAPVAFEIMDPDGTAYVTIHTLRLQNTIDETHIRLPYLPIKSSVTNNGNNTDCQIRSGSWQGGVMGLCQVCGNRPFHFPLTPGPETVLDIGTTLTPLAAFRSKSTFQGFENKVRAKLDFFTFIPYDGDGIVTLQLIAQATINGTEGIDYNFIDVDAANSVLEVSTDLTGFTGGVPGLTLYGNPTTSGSKQLTSPEDLDAEALGLFLDPGQIYIIAAQINIGTTDINWAVNWTELF